MRFLKCLLGKGTYLRSYGNPVLAPFNDYNTSTRISRFSIHLDFFLKKFSIIESVFLGCIWETSNIGQIFVPQSCGYCFQILITPALINLLFFWGRNWQESHLWTLEREEWEEIMINPTRHTHGSWGSMAWWLDTTWVHIQEVPLIRSVTWAGFLISLCFSFFDCKVRILKYLPYKIIWS